MELKLVLDLTLDLIVKMKGSGDLFAHLFVR